LSDAVVEYQKATHPLTDAPSKRVLHFASIEIDDMVGFHENAVAALDTRPTPDWYLTLTALIQECGGLDGTREVPKSSGPLPRGYSGKPHKYDPVPRRDERFQDPWNQAVNAEHFLYSPDYPPDAKALMMLYKRLREIDVPEMMAGILAETPGKPWGYYRDMSRQLWDEARHAMMGEVGFVALGVDWTQARVTWNWSYRLNTECTPAERHAVLFFIEQGLMPKTGKRYEYEVASVSGIPLMATIQDFDWADEVLHSQIGRQWLVPEYGGLTAALKYGDECWSRILSNWATVKAKGLTDHANWWPAVYSQACAASGTVPDAAVLSYDVSYDGRRADVHRAAAE
jgi:hypothetical protein